MTQCRTRIDRFIATCAVSIEPEYLRATPLAHVCFPRNNGCPLWTLPFLTG